MVSVSEGEGDWRGAEGWRDAAWAEKDKVHLGEELSDVMLYLVRLAGAEWIIALQ